MAPLPGGGNAIGCIASAADRQGQERCGPLWFFHTPQLPPGIPTTGLPGEAGSAPASLRQRRRACQKPALFCDADVSL
jgi:hypothetical protein